MSTAIQTEARIRSVSVTDEAILAHLADGRIVSVPLKWSWRLSDATPQQRERWELIGDGQGVHWPDVDEDISVEGLLRGTPARRPARTEMRILLDASSLIDLEHERPVSFAKLDTMLREQHARLVLTFTSVRELAAGVTKTGDFLGLRAQLQQIERLPLGYLREGGITRSELKEAVAAFKNHREYLPIDPYVKRWDETLVWEGSSPAEMLVNQSLYDLVSMATKRGSGVRRAEERWEGPLRQQFEDDRELPPGTRKAAEKHFPETIRAHLALYSIPFPSEQIKELADWIYSNPIRSPGYRLAYDFRQDLMNNVTENVSGNDIFDRAHVLAVPYVDAITMDRNTAALCRRVSRRLSKKNPAIRYEERIFAGLKDLLDSKF